MLKENRNIDESYTDRVVRQLVDETEIDFNAGRVRLPAVAYSWPFHNFGPGGLENALRMTPRNNFGHHIITNYGVDDGEFEEVLTKYIGVIDGRIRDGLSELINKRDRENPHWLQENKNIDWDYTDRVVKQLVDETEIDFKNRRVRLDAAEFSFPFYSFGGRRAYPENIISEPKSNFGKYVISNYGVDETEYKEIYAMYMGIIASRLQDHDENINHLHLHESTEDKFLDTIVSQLVDETEIDFEYGMPHISAFPDPGFSIDSSFNLNLHLSENLFGNMFKSFWSHCRNVYGLTDPEIQKVWGEYKKEALKKIDFNKWIINESTEDNFLDKIVDQLVDESIIDYDNNRVDFSDFPTPFNPLNLIALPPPSLFADPFYEHCREVYGLTPEEITYVWKKYKSIIVDKIKNKPLFALIDGRRLNESTEDNFLDTIVSQLVDETIIHYEGGTPYIADFPDPAFSSFYLLKGDYTGKGIHNIFGEMYNSLWRHCRNVYGLTDPEIYKVWQEYKKEIIKKIEWKGSLNESTEDNFLDKIVDQLISETIIDYDNKDFEAPFIPPSLTNNLTIPFSFSSSFFSSFLFKYCREVYGLTAEETWYVWQEYEKIIRDKINNKPLNESTEDNFLDKIVERLVAETQVFNDRGQLRANPPFFQSEGDDVEVEGRITGVVGGMPLAELIGSVESKEFDSSLAFMDFKYYCKQMYGLTWEECHEVWDKYREALYNTDFSHLYKPNVYLNESTEDNFLDKIVNQLVDETILKDDEYEIPVAYPSWITDGGFGGEGVAVDILLDSDKNSVNFVEFRYYANNMYGLDEDEIPYVWDQYRLGIWDKEQKRINDYHRSLEDEDLNESKKDLNSYIHTVVDKMVDDTHLKYKKTTNTIWVKLPFYIMLNNKGKNIEEVSSTYITSPTARVVAEIRKHLILIYGMDKWETDQAAIMYLSKMTDKINDYKDKGFDDNWNELNESAYHDYKDPLLSSKSHDLIKKVVDQLMNETQLIFSPQPPVQNTMEKNYRGGFVRAPYITKGWWGGESERGMGMSQFMHGSPKILDKIEKYIKGTYGLTEREGDVALINYNSRIRNKIKHTDPHNKSELTESEDKEENHLDKIVDHLINETNFKYSHSGSYVDPTQFTNKERESLDSYIDAPFLDGIYLSSHILHSARAYHSFVDYSKEVFGLTEDEMEYIWEKYEMNLREILHNKLNESVDLSYSDDKDFPFLNKLANHTMSITEIERNAVLFPFIDGYISDGNFHKYFNSVPLEDIPFEASLSLDEYLRDFGLTENEKEIWWDIYVIKVIDAINERDSRIIDSHGELYEHAEPEDPIYEKIAQSIANESEIVISPSPYNKMFLRSPAWKEAQHIENVIDQLTGRIKDVVPDRFVKHLKEIYNIKYPTFVQKVWELYRDKMLERIKIKQAQQRQIIPKQQKFFDHIVKTLVDETEIESTRHVHDEGRERIWVTPPFLTHGVDVPRYREDSVEWNEFSYFGYGYPRYMKDIYGLTDQEGLKLWAPYYKALEKKVDELIERDRIIYGDD